MDNTTTIIITWHIDDVRSIRPDLSDEQAFDVLYSVKENHDASIGVNWDVISCVADHLFPIQQSPDESKGEV